MVSFHFRFHPGYTDGGCPVSKVCLGSLRGHFRSHALQKQASFHHSVGAAHDHLTGMVRRGVLLMLYTGQRGSDAVRLGPWCPIMPELA